MGGEICERVVKSGSIMGALVRVMKGEECVLGGEEKLKGHQRTSGTSKETVPGQR